VRATHARGRRFAAFNAAGQTKVQIMTRAKLTLSVAAATGALVLANQSSIAWAQSNPDTAAIRQMVEQMKRDYESKIRALEQRLEKAEGDAQAAKDSAAQTKAAVAAQPKVASTAAASPAAAPNANAFNPQISGVLNGTFGAFSHTPGDRRIPGFALGGEATEANTRGFSLGESEVSLSANIDQALYGQLVLSFTSEDEVAVEEGFIQTTSLPWGFTAKAGRFFSGIGYLNQRHAHDWDFVDAPLPYLAMLNGQYGDDGVQLRWLAPTPFFLEFGGELFRGEAFPAAGSTHGGVGTQTVFVRAGDDIDDSSSWQAGLSYLRAGASGRETGDTPDVFSGRTDLGIASLVYKWAPDGNVRERNLTLAGEFFLQRQTGDFNGTTIEGYQTGWYAQAVYQFMPGWRAGLRYDEVNADDVDVALTGTALDNMGHTPRRGTALVEYDTSEFGRIRLQYSRDDSDVRSNDQLLLQYTVIFGPHGAHQY
jgi:outer membrane murein-binding lipoprotein Lpp